MLLLRSNNGNGLSGTTQPSGEVSRENDAGLIPADNLERVTSGTKKLWTPAPAVEPVLSSVGEIKTSEQQNTSQPPSPVKRSPEEEDQYKKDRAIEQQQSILRQVAERRAARVSRTESEISADDEEPPAKWERGQKVSPERSGDETQILGKKSNPCRKNGHDHDWADCPDNRSSDAYVEKKTEKKERANPCRKPGHDHDWNHCPDNRKSEEYAAKMEEKKEKKAEKEKRKEEKQEEKPRPCRIEGHDHDW
jgi:hypothetical protein